MSYTIPYLDCCAGDPFGATEGRPNAHRGQDVAPGGQDYPAWVEGVVAFAGNQSCLGNVVSIRNDADGYFVGISHLANLKLKQGDRVKIGTPQGNLGSTGSCQNGRHGHITVSPSSPYPWTGAVIDPVAYARAASGGGIGQTNFHWYELTKDAMLAMQKMLNVLKLYGGEDDSQGGTGPEDGDFGERSVKGMQAYFKRRTYLAADYLVDGIPHNPDQSAPSNYGFSMQAWARDDAGYDGRHDGLPAGYTSSFLVTAANKVAAAGTPKPPEPPKPTPIPALPPAKVGHYFMPDLATSQGDFDFEEYATAGGQHVALKMGGGNASDSPYIAPRYLDQLNRARVRNLWIMHYWFNGRENGLTPEKSADYFAEHIELLTGEIFVIDIEREDDTDTDPYTPAEAVAFVKQLQTHYRGARGLFYMSKSLYDSQDWSALEALGWERWTAAWGSNSGDPESDPAGDEYAWQYTSNETVPGNYVVVNGKKEYQRTDGNLIRADVFQTLGWREQPIPEPEPEPEPGNSVSKELFADYLAAQSEVNAEYAAKLAA